MKKVYIISKKNEEKDIFETQRIVIFNENSAPTSIEYKSALDLMPVVKIAEENGLDIFNGIEPVIEAGLIQVVSMSDEKAMDELKNLFVKESLTYYGSKKENTLKNEQPEEVKKLTKEIQPVVEQQPAEEEKKDEEKVAVIPVEKVEESVEESSDESQAEEEHKITAETTMFKPIIGIDLPVEDREYAQYLSLNMKRANGEATEEELAKIEELAKYNEKVAAMEKARQEVIDAHKEHLTAVGPASKENAEKTLIKKRKAYDDLTQINRKKLADAIKAVAKKDEEAALTEALKKEESVIVAPVTITEEKAPVVVAEQAKSAEEKEEEKKAEQPVSIIPAVVPVQRTNVVIEEDKKEENKENKSTEENTPVVVTPVVTGPDKTTSEDKDYKPNFILVPEDRTGEKAEGIHPDTEVEHKVVINDQKITAKTTSKFKKFLKRVGQLLLAVGLITGVVLVIDAVKDAIAKRKNNNNNNNSKDIQRERTLTIGELGLNGLVVNSPKATEEPKETATPAVVVTEEPKETETPVVVTEEPTATAEPKVTEDPTITRNRKYLNNYFASYSGPEATKIFLQRQECLDFLYSIPNEAQLKIAIDALSYGYEANILTTKDGNFRLNEDGETYLTSFTHDFLCAKAVVNRYNARQMLAVFGGPNISYEEMMQGFQSYTHTVRTYFLNGVERLPFNYLIDSPVALETVNRLQDSVIAVNRARANNTLDSTITDDFISTTFDIFVKNDETLSWSQGAKDVGGAIVDAFCCMQAQIDNGEPLYLHEDRGLAKAGTNLADVDGHFTFNYPDKTHYEFSSLFDVMNHGYGDVNETAYRCLSQQEELLATINTMSLLDTSNVDEASRDLEYALRLEGFNEEADRIKKGDTSDELLDTIVSYNPIFTDEVETLRHAKTNTADNYMPFNEVCEKIDTLLGIKYRPVNDYATLFNNRRSAAVYYKGYKVVTGKKYTQKRSYTPTQSRNEDKKPEQQNVTTETTVVVEKVEEKDLTPEEVVVVEEQKKEIEEEFEQKNEEAMANAEEGIKEMTEAVVEGKSDEEIKEIAEEHGITLNDEYIEKKRKAEEEKAEGEKKQKEIEESVEQHNEENEAKSKEEDKQREEQYEEEYDEMAELIAQSQALENPTDPTPDEPAPEEPDSEEPTPEEPAPETPVDEGESYYDTHDEEIDQNDPNRVDEEAGEEVYIPTTGKNNYETLKQLRELALAAEVDVKELKLTRNFGSRA